ncbi:hypothetical protein F4859DRAFT_529979 [Xylaria cf. heliscus]|nr:hypothetical protein F4859DRAFT_529979 [Xylaria cf. heliscus]
MTLLDPLLLTFITLLTSLAHGEKAVPIKPRGWTDDWKTEQVVLSSPASSSSASSSSFADESCTISRAGRYTMSGHRGRDPVFFSTSSRDDLLLPSIEPMNGTGSEQWEFDGVSEDGKGAFCFGFYRDPNYSIFGTGYLRAYAEVVFEDGRRYSVLDYAEESVIESCPGRGTRGVWRGDGFEYSFEFSADMSKSRITFKNPEASGVVAMTSAAPPRYADGKAWPSENAELVTVPHFYWTQPVPVATSVVDVVVKGDVASWSGIAGHERLWGAFNWYTCLESLFTARILAGPFAVTFLDLGSGRERGLHVPSVFLAEHGERVVGTRRTTPSDTEDYFSLHKIYGGDGVTTKALSDKVTGIEVRIFSPSQGKEWRFSVIHKNVVFEYDLGGGLGGTAYSGTAEGGVVDEEQWNGPAFTEVMKFPETSMLLTRNYVE